MERWASKLGFLLAAIGSAIGIGNVWRFSYIAYSSGTLAFLLIYLFSILTVGVPLLMLEFSLGHFSKSSVPKAFSRISRPAGILGWLMVFNCWMISVYYALILSWILAYAGYSITLAWGHDPIGFFQTFSTERIEIQLLLLVFVWFFAFSIVKSGVREGIEYVSRIFVPLMWALMAGLFMLSFERGLPVLPFSPSDFLDLKLWMLALGQAFFSLSVAFGSMHVYAGYVREKLEIRKSTIITALADSGFSFLSFFTLLLILGNTVVPKEDEIGLAFISVPLALNQLGAGFGLVFFSVLFLLGITSLIAMVETAVSALEERFGFGRTRASGTACLLPLLFGFLLCLLGKPGIILIDGLGAAILVLLGFMESVILGWFFLPNLSEHLRATEGRPIGRKLRFWIKFVLPAILFLVLLSRLV
ncbi:MAG: hypothetical protein DRP12_02220 [Candidatus Aenigmatarchaeota archaeon]|nr:MAG: hypothetical protein DRP12_02220 [Candidatus Aenigmarchaeota archaeon]